MTTKIDGKEPMDIPASVKANIEKGYPKATAQSLPNAKKPTPITKR